MDSHSSHQATGNNGLLACSRAVGPAQPVVLVLTGLWLQLQHAWFQQGSLPSCTRSFSPDMVMVELFIARSWFQQGSAPAQPVVLVLTGFWLQLEHAWFQCSAPAQPVVLVLTGFWLKLEHTWFQCSAPAEPVVLVLTWLWLKQLEHAWFQQSSVPAVPVVFSPYIQNAWLEQSSAQLSPQFW